MGQYEGTWEVGNSMEVILSCLTKALSWKECKTTKNMVKRTNNSTEIPTIYLQSTSLESHHCFDEISAMFNVRMSFDLGSLNDCVNYVYRNECGYYSYVGMIPKGELGRIWMRRTVSKYLYGLAENSSGRILRNRKYLEFKKTTCPASRYWNT